MKKRTQKIDKVVSLAAAEERRVGEEAGVSRRRLSEQLTRLGELNAYRQNYRQKSAATSGMSAVHWQDYQNFLHRLNHAVQSQQQIINDCEQSFEAHRQRWMIKRQKLESLERVLDKYLAEDASYAARLEQKRLDSLPNNTRRIFDRHE